MSLPNTYGLDDFQQIIANAYGAAIYGSGNGSGNVPVNIGTGSQFGPSFNAVSLAMLLLQNENVYIDSIARLATMQDPLPNGLPNPDVDTFVNAFEFYRLGSQPAIVAETFSVPSPVPSAGVLIPVNTVVSCNGGPTFTVIPNGPGYNAAGNGYFITVGNTSVTGVPIQCNVGGLAGNVLPGTITQVIGNVNGTPAPFSCTNPAGPYVLGAATEVGAPLKNRFALYISGGGEGTPASILSAVYGVQGGLTVAYGDLVKSTVHNNGTLIASTPNTPSWFTVLVALANSGQTPGDGGALANSVSAAIINAVRPAGISFAVAYPQITTVNVSAQVWVAPGYNQTSVLAAVQAAAQVFVNGIGMNQYGNPTVLSIGQGYVALMAVPGVQYIDQLQYNGQSGDLTAPFGTMFGYTAIGPGFIAA